jgi:hypothetical protein
LPLLAVTMALGFLFVSVANVAARNSTPWAEAVYWVGLLTIVLPVVTRLLRASIAQTERVTLVVLLGLVLFMCDFVSSPLAANTFDEFLHLRTAQDMLVTGTLFSPNSLLPISPYYPGMELGTTAISQLSGLGIMESGAILLASARVILTLSLFLLFDKVSGSARLAAVASLIYCFNPRYLYFDSQFAYESLALPLAALAAFGIARRSALRPRHDSTSVLILLAVATVVVSHHVTSLAMASMVILWASAHWIGRWRRAGGRYVASIAGTAVVAIVAWALVVATPVVTYLATPVAGAGRELASLLFGEGSMRTPFTSVGAGVAPLWEQIVGYAAVTILVVGVVLGLRQLHRMGKSQPVVLVLALAAFAYPFTLIARLTDLGATVAARTPEFIFVGVSFVAGTAVMHIVGPARSSAPQVRLMTVLAGVVLVGGVIVGTPQWDRLPGPYLVSADGRSVETNGIGAARWAYRELGPGNRLVADRVNQLLMATYGRQDVLTSYDSGINLTNLYETPALTPNQVALVQEMEIRLVVVDLRLTTALPVIGFYFQRSEREGPPRTTPLQLLPLRKFDAVPGVDRLFDDGSIRIYDVSALALAP